MAAGGLERLLEILHETTASVLQRQEERWQRQLRRQQAGGQTADIEAERSEDGTDAASASAAAAVPERIVWSEEDREHFARERNIIEKTLQALLNLSTIAHLQVRTLTKLLCPTRTSPCLYGTAIYHYHHHQVPLCNGGAEVVLLLLQADVSPAVTEAAHGLLSNLARNPKNSTRYAAFLLPQSSRLATAEGGEVTPCVLHETPQVVQGRAGDAHAREHATEGASQQARPSTRGV